MKCPHCGFSDSKVTDSRNVGEGVRRRRQCLDCEQRFTTYERVQTTSLLIVKKGGLREEFNRDKMAGGISKACQKRPMPAGAVEKLIDDIEVDLHKLGKSEVASTEVGEIIMDRLRDFDHIAYIRFASVYREFTDIGSLKEEVDTLARVSESSNLLPGQLPLIPEDQLAHGMSKNTLRRIRRNYA